MLMTFCECRTPAAAPDVVTFGAVHSGSAVLLQRKVAAEPLANQITADTARRFAGQQPDDAQLALLILTARTGLSCG